MTRGRIQTNDVSVNPSYLTRGQRKEVENGEGHHGGTKKQDCEARKA